MYKGKTVLITGTSKGVGKMLASYFIKNNAKVIGIDQDNDNKEVNFHCCDLSNPYLTEVVIKAIRETETNPIDIVINNAAVLTSQYAVKMKTEDAHAMVMVDLLAPFFLARGLGRAMPEGGRIINISSMAVALEPMGDSMYAACKAGLNKMSNIMAKEFAGFGITVNTLAISAIETDMLKQLNREKIDKVVAGLPIPRYATIDDITNVIDFFCSPKSDYITAQTIYLGGVHN